jgi:hypothetical protein
MVKGGALRDVDLGGCLDAADLTVGRDFALAGFDLVVVFALECRDFAPADFFDGELFPDWARDLAALVADLRVLDFLPVVDLATSESLACR